MQTANKNLLLVEGRGEQFALPFLMDEYTVWGDKRKDCVVEIKPLGGVDTILKPGVIEAESKTPGLKALGVIIDANDSFESRWTRLKERCRKIASSVPEDLPQQGLLHTTPKGLRLGVWIMPDNESRGMMETFLARLLSPECADIWELARDSCMGFPACSPPPNLPPQGGGANSARLSALLLLRRPLTPLLRSAPLPQG